MVEVAEQKESVVDDLPDLLRLLLEKPGFTRQHPNCKTGPVVSGDIDVVVQVAGELAWTDEEESGDVCFECATDPGLVYRLRRLTQSLCKLSLEGYVDEEEANAGPVRLDDDEEPETQEQEHA